MGKYDPHIRSSTDSRSAKSIFLCAMYDARIACYSAFAVYVTGPVEAYHPTSHRYGPTLVRSKFGVKIDADSRNHYHEMDPDLTKAHTDHKCICGTNVLLRAHNKQDFLILGLGIGFYSCCSTYVSCARIKKTFLSLRFS